MAKLLPFRSEPDVRSDPQLVNIDDEAADDVFAALSSGTARAILGYLYEEPATASDIAEAVDTSLQNARYHLDKLRDAGLVEAVDTWYSSRGTEMTVYAPTSDPLVVAAGREERTSVLRQALSRLVGAVGVLALASVLIDRLARTVPTRQVAPAATSDRGGGGGDETELAVTGNASTTDAPAETVAETATTSAPNAAEVTPEATSGPETATRVVERTVVETATPKPEATETQLAEGTVAGATPTPAPTPTSTPTPAGVDGGIVEAILTNPPPGLLFFAGGLLVLALATGWWYWSRYRPLYA